MRILCVIDTFRIGGGAQTQLAGLAVMLKSRGHDVATLSYYKNSPDVSCEPYLEDNGVVNICLDEANNMFDKFIGVKRAIADFEPDTVIAYIDGPTSICCIIKALGGKFRLIVSERNVTQSISFKEKVKFWLYRFSDLIVPNAHSQERFIKNNYPYLADKVCTISNFVDTAVFQYRKPLMYIDKRQLEILVVARINPQKNVLLFLDALNILRKKGFSFHVDWYGRSSLKYFEICMSHLEELGLEKHISFYDAVKNINAIYVNNKYDVYCLPSLFEGCPNTIGEAMSCGLPILCSNVCDNSICVKCGVNGFLFDPSSPEDICNAIIAFSQTTFAERVKMGENSRQIAIEKLSKDAFVARYLEII